MIEDNYVAAQYKRDVSTPQPELAEDDRAAPELPVGGSHSSIGNSP